MAQLSRLYDNKKRFTINFNAYIKLIEKKARISLIYSQLTNKALYFVLNKLIALIKRFEKKKNTDTKNIIKPILIC